MDKPTQEQIADMRNFSGEENLSSGGAKPEFIGFNGKPDQATSGNYSIGKDDTFKDLGKIIKCVIVKVRSQYKTDMNDPNDYVTDEYDAKTDNTTLKDKNDKYNEIVVGTPGDIKEMYYNKFKKPLKFSHIVYVYSPESKKVYRLEVGGGSVNALWEYLKTFAKNDEGSNDTTFRYITKFGSVLAKSQDGKFAFTQMTFERDGVYADWNEIWDEVQNLNNLLGSGNTAKTELLKDGANEDVVVIDDEKDNEEVVEDEVNVDNIPF